MNARWAMAIGLLLLQGCTYAISPETAAQADKTITFEMVLADPDSFKGKVVVLGGTIAQIENTKEGTVIEIVQKPLDYWGKPKRTNKSGGRFLVFSPGYLDTLIYAPGRQITAAAEIEGTRSKALGGMEYSYPLLLAKEMKLWPLERPTWSTPQWLDPLYDPYGPERRSF